MLSGVRGNGLAGERSAPKGAFWASAVQPLDSRSDASPSLIGMYAIFFFHYTRLKPSHPPARYPKCERRLLFNHLPLFINITFKSIYYKRFHLRRSSEASFWVSSWCKRSL